MKSLFLLRALVSNQSISKAARFSIHSRMTQKVSSMRVDYSSDGFFLENDLAIREPMGQFEAWFKDAVDCKEIHEPNAMVLSTCSKDGQPSARTVLLKGFDKDGFTFFTNYESQKGRELIENPKACLLFYWPPLYRQVIIKGCAQKISYEKSLEYFHSRPRGSQIGACVSKQSSVISSRQELNLREAELKKQYEDTSIPVPKPDYWGGFLIIPESVEFWRGQSSRLHDRIRFRRHVPSEDIDSNITKIGEDGWLYERLSP